MFGIGFPELIFIFILILIVFGPERLPDIFQSVGKAIGTLRKSSDALRREFYNSVYTPANDFQNNLDEVKRELKTITTECDEEEVNIEEKNKKKENSLTSNATPSSNTKQQK